MIKILQINLHCCKEAQSFLLKTSIEQSTDLLFITEFHHNEGPTWYPDKSNKAAIINYTNLQIDEIGASEPGFCWIKMGNLRLYSCYSPPSLSHQEFLTFLTRLEMNIRSSHSDILITGDLNAHHPDWGSRASNKRGEALSDLINAQGLVVCNIGKKPTFQNSNGSSIIDLTIASPATAAKISEWKVLDTLSLSDHDYITFTLNPITNITRPNTNKWNTGKLNYVKLETVLKSTTCVIDLNNMHAEDCAKILTTNIQDTCQSIMPSPPNNQRKSVYW